MSAGATNGEKLYSVIMRALCVLTCLLLPVLTWSESFLDLVKVADAPTVQALIDAESDPEARDEWGRTPLLHAAFYNQNAAVVQALIDAGADATATNKDGETAWDLIQENEALERTPVYWALNDLRSQ